VAKMIEPRRDGKHNFYSIQKDHFHQIMGELFSNMINDGKSVGFGDFLVTQQK
jgi:ArsR family transcriptional regulator